MPKKIGILDTNFVPDLHDVLMHVAMCHINMHIVHDVSDMSRVRLRLCSHTCMLSLIASQCGTCGSKVFASNAALGLTHLADE